MTNGRLFWGVLLVQLGVLVGLDRLDFLPPLDVPLEYWPVILILLGLARLVRVPWVKTVSIILAALYLGLIIVALVRFDFLHDDGIIAQGTGERQELVQTFDAGIHKASLLVDVSAGRIKVGDTTRDLLHATAETNAGSYGLSSERTGEEVKMTLRIRDHAVIFPGRSGNELDISLNDAPEWRLEFDVGAARMEADLRALNTPYVRIDAGAAAVDLRLGTSSPECHVEVDAGAASVRLEIPRTAGCEIRIDAGLSNKDFPDFEKIGSNLYRTENFENAEQTILIAVDAGASNISVERY